MVSVRGLYRGGEVSMTNDQKEALKKVFSAYENYDNSLSYARDVLKTVKELAIVFPAISLENDELGLFKNIYFMRKKEATND